MTDDEATPPPHDADDWLVSGAPHEEYAAASRSGRRERLRTVAKPAALVVAGLVLGIGAVSAAQAVAGDEPDTTGAAAVDRSGVTDGDEFDGHRLPPGLEGGPFPGGTAGGLAGEQHVTGTLTAIGDSTVTVESANGTATYQVDALTQIVRDGATAELADLAVGDPVLVHVLPASSDSERMIVERIFAGALPSGPGLGPRDDDDDGGDDGDGAGTTGRPPTNT